ncbi:MAG TPA: metal-dependent hydrolase [Chitinophagales bacterium]
MKFTYYGHSSFSIELNGKQLLFDPFISPNELAKSIDVNSIAADYIFVSHGHFDHVADLVAIAQRTNATVIASWEIYVWLEKQGLKNLHPMNTGGKWNFDFGSVKCVVAQHSSSLPDGTYGGNPMGFVVDGGNGETFYYSGDTALTLDMQLIPRTSAALKFALFPIGDNFTMGIDDAIIAAEFVKASKVIGLHFDTFGYIKINHEQALAAFQQRDRTLLLPEIGKSLEL